MSTAVDSGGPGWAVPAPAFAVAGLWEPRPVSGSQGCPAVAGMRRRIPVATRCCVGRPSGAAARRCRSSGAALPSGRTRRGSREGGTCYAVGRAEGGGLCGKGRTFSSAAPAAGTLAGGCACACCTLPLANGVGYEAPDIRLRVGGGGSRAGGHPGWAAFLAAPRPGHYAGCAL